jgi:glycosyltransferase involved in cell wall biosynthesis
MFSVIIPLYNKADYIEKSIGSVFAQTYEEFELIVVNDGSTDDSLKNLRFRIYDLKLSEEKIKIIDQLNQGVSIARNNGVKVSKYDFIAFLDADDWWEPTYLEEMKQLIEAYPEAGIWGSNYFIVKNGYKRIAPIGVTKNFKKGIINYFSVYSRTLCMPLWAGAVILKKTIFENEKGFKPNLKLGEDFDLWVRVTMKYPVAFVNKPLAYYNQDVELANRAIGEKLYEPSEHMLFTNYGELQNNIEFRELYDKLVVYGLLPYYLCNKNKREVETILKGINWKKQPYKYRLYYRILPKFIVRSWFGFIRVASKIKSKI